MHRNFYRLFTGFFLLLGFWCMATQATEIQARKDSAIPFDITPLPNWIDRDAITAIPPMPLEGSQTGRRALLTTYQINTTLRTPRYYFSRHFVIDTLAGLSDFAKIDFQFFPAYEKLHIHQIYITRGGKKLNRLIKSELKMVSAESNLEQHVYIGEAHVFQPLKDLQVGDIISISHSVEGSNPVFGNNYSQFSALYGRSFIHQQRIKLVMPSGSSQRYQLHGINGEKSESVVGNQHIVKWDIRNIPAAPREADLPAGYIDLPFFSFSTFADYASLAKWGGDLYGNIPGDSSISAMAAQLRTQADVSPEAQIVAATRYVQDKIRYFSVSHADSSHRPHPPALTLKNGYGDCKDKSILLIALLKDLGISARPVLVSTYFNENVERLIANPYNFNHVIVEVRLKDQSYWIDGTRMFQRGSLAQIGRQPFKRGLILSEKESALSPITPLTEDDFKIVAEDYFDVKKFHRPATALLKTTYHGALADTLRAQFSQTSHNELEKIRGVELTRRYPDAKRKGELKIVDDEENNTFSVIDRYEIPKFFTETNGRRDAFLFASELVEFFRIHIDPNRKTPIGISYPMRLTQNIRSEWPRTPLLSDPQKKGSESFKASGWEISARFDWHDRTLSNTFDFHTLKNTVPANEIRTEIGNIEKGRQYLGYGFSFGHFGISRNTVGNDYREALQKALKQPHYTNEERAEIHRALSWIALHKDDPQAYLAGHIKATELDREDGYAWGERAIAHEDRGQFDEAAIAANKALSLGENGQAINYFLGRHYLLSGDNQKAASYFQEAVNSAGTDEHELAYANIWLAFAQKNLGIFNPEKLAQSWQPKDEAAWPASIRSYIIGKINADDLLKAAAKGSTEEQKDKLCEANFYIARNLFAEGKREEARIYLQKTIDTGVVDFIEYSYAKNELAKLRGVN